MICLFLFILVNVLLFIVDMVVIHYFGDQIYSITKKIENFVKGKECNYEIRC